MSQQPNGVVPFEPARFMSRVNGSDYLEVKWRLVWLRDRHPDAHITTELVDHSPQHAIFKATITIPNGGSATGYGSETPGDFRDYIEKSETKSIGRALAALGFGTQFTPDHEFGASVGRVVDAPVKRHREAAPATGAGAEQTHAASHATQTATGVSEQATQRQLRYLQAVAREVGLDGVALDERAMQEFGVVAAALTRRDASTLIDLLQSSQTGGAQAPAASSAARSGPVDRVRQGREEQQPSRPTPTPGATPSPKQWEYLDGLVRDAGLDQPGIDELVMLRYGVATQAMDRASISELIDGLKAVKEGRSVLEELYPVKPKENAASAVAHGDPYADMPSPWDEEEAAS